MKSVNNSVLNEPLTILQWIMPLKDSPGRIEYLRCHNVD